MKRTGLHDTRRTSTEIKMLTMGQVPTTDELKFGELAVDMDNQTLYASDQISVVKLGRGKGAPSLQEVTNIGNTSDKNITVVSGNNKTTISSLGISIDNQDNLKDFSIIDGVVSGGEAVRESFENWLDLDPDSYLLDLVYVADQNVWNSVYASQYGPATILHKSLVAVVGTNDSVEKTIVTPINDVTSDLEINLNQEINDRINAINQLQAEIDTLQNGYILIGSTDFGTDTPTDQQLTDYVNSIKGGDPILTGDTVLNLYDTVEWYWNEQLGQWINFGGPVKAIVTIGTVYVNKNSTSASQDGTQYAPYKTIQAAINAAQFGDIIEISAEQYDESLIINDKSNITLNAVGTTGQYRTVVNGSITISGTSTRIGINNLQFNQIFNKNSNGTLYIDNCAMLGMNINNSGYSRLDFCFISGNLNCDNGYTDLFNCQFEEQAVAVMTANAGPDKRLYLENCLLITIQDHSGGILISQGSTQFVSTSTNPNSITSTCAAGNGAIYLLGGSTFNGISYSKINKTGDCPWSTGIFLHEPTIDVFNGTEIPAGLHDVDLWSHRTAVNYITSNSKISSHLNGIDQKLGDLTVNKTKRLVTIPVSNWIVDGSNFKYTITDSNIKTTSTIDIIPTRTYQDVSDVAMFYQEIDVLNGSVTVYCRYKPISNIIVILSIY